MTRGNVRSVVRGGRSYLGANCHACRGTCRQPRNSRLPPKLKNIIRSPAPFRKPAKRIGWLEFDCCLYL